MRLFGLSLVVLGVAAVAADNSCMLPSDCNTLNCQSCKCVNSQCVCGGGWSGDKCATPFCNGTRASCSNHGNCSMSIEDVSCACDSGFEGPHCETAACNCQHGGTAADASCTKCNCLGAWTGQFCDVWDDDAPVPELITKLEVAANESQAMLDSWPATSMCAQNSECVGWGIDGATGTPTLFPIVHLTLDPNASGHTFAGGRVSPIEVNTVEVTNPEWAGLENTQAFATVDELESYINTNFAGQSVGTASGSVYSKPLEDTVKTFFQIPGNDRALTVARASKAFFTMELPFDPVTKVMSYKLDKAAHHAASQMPENYTTPQHKALFRWFITKYGTSYARKASMGALIEQHTSWQTPLLRDPAYGFTPAKLVTNAEIDLAASAQIKGPTQAHDAHYADMRTDELFCDGGDHTTDCKSDMVAWKQSADTKKYTKLISFEIDEISSLLQVTHPAMAPFFAEAVKDYLADKAAAWAAADHCPSSCNSKGFCAPGSAQCTCACYYGNGCSGNLKPGCQETCSDGASTGSCAAWRELFDSTDGPNWGGCNTNRENPTACFGVKHTAGDITEIAMPNAGLTGTLPPSLGTLTALKRLAVMGNALYGSIPPSLGGASSLQRLELNSNQLVGEVPAAIGNISSLNELWLSENKLSGFGGPLTQDFSSCSLPATEACCDLSHNAFACPAWLNSTTCVATC